MYPLVLTQHSDKSVNWLTLVGEERGATTEFLQSSPNTPAKPIEKAITLKVNRLSSAMEPMPTGF